MPRRQRAPCEPIAQRFGLTLEAAADSAVALANANIVRAIQLISTERGHDPRDYVLVPYGGAGPLHAAKVAEELGIATIVVPPSAGIISAYGLIASDFVLFESMTHRAVADERAADVLREVFRVDARPGARAGGGERIGGPARLVADGRDALRRPGLRGAGARSRKPSSKLSTQRRAAEVRRGAPARLLLRRRSRQSRSSSCRSGSASWRRSKSCRCWRRRRRPERQRARSASSTARPGETRASCAAAHLRDTKRMTRARADRGPDLDPLRARRLDGAARRQRQHHSGAAADHAGPRNRSPQRRHDGRRSARPRRLRRHLPGADRHCPRDGHQAHPLVLFQHRARGPGRVRRAVRRAGQRRRAGRADPDAPGLDVRDLPRLRRAVPDRQARARRLLHQQRSLRRRPAPAGRVHLHADLRRRPDHRLRRHGGAPSRSRRRQSRHDAGRGRRARRGHHHPALALHLRPRLERRAARAAGRGQCARALADHRRFLCPVRGQRDRDGAHGGAERPLRRARACWPP